MWSFCANVDILYRNLQVPAKTEKYVKAHISAKCVKHINTVKPHYSNTAYNDLPDKTNEIFGRSVQYRYGVIFWEYNELPNL